MTPPGGGPIGPMSPNPSESISAKELSVTVTLRPRENAGDLAFRGKSATYVVQTVMKNAAWLVLITPGEREIAFPTDMVESVESVWVEAEE